jgi:hypothetical protein
LPDFRKTGFWMRVSIIRGFICSILVVTVTQFLLGQDLAAQDLPAHAGGAILHTQGGVWVNGSEARDSAAVFPDDLIETKPGASADLSIDGSTVLIAPETVAKFEGDYIELDHGGVSVATSRSFRVHIKCMKVIPVDNDWTQYVVTDLNGTVVVTARKKDVNVEHEGIGRDKAAKEAAEKVLQHASVLEGQQKNYDESEVCGAAAPTGASSMLSPKWIAAGAAGAGILIWLLIHGSGGKSPISASEP